MEHTHASHDQAIRARIPDPFQIAVTFPHKGIELAQ
jgi:hypothetical protein